MAADCAHTGFALVTASVFQTVICLSCTKLSGLCFPGAGCRLIQDILLCFLHAGKQKTNSVSQWGHMGSDEPQAIANLIFFLHILGPTVWESDFLNARGLAPPNYSQNISPVFLSSRSPTYKNLLHGCLTPSRASISGNQFPHTPDLILKV